MAIRTNIHIDKSEQYLYYFNYLYTGFGLVQLNISTGDVVSYRENNDGIFMVNIVGTMSTHSDSNTIYTVFVDNIDSIMAICRYNMNTYEFF